MTVKQQALRAWEGIKARRWARILFGVLLILGGLAGPVLPLLGVWMLPLGLLLLAVDFAWAQRLHDRLERWWQRHKPGRR